MAQLDSNSPTKKRKVVNGNAIPVKLDKESQQNQLRLLKQRMKKRRSSSPTISTTHLSQNSTQSSSPSISSHNSAWSYPKNANTMRRMNAKFIGRRSHTLKLAAKSSLNTSPKIVCLFLYLINLNLFFADDNLCPISEPKFELLKPCGSTQKTGL